MKQELSSIDLYFLIKELKKVEGGFLGKTYSAGKKKLFFQVYNKVLGKKFLTYYHPFFWLGNKKISNELSSFAVYMRKYYERAKIISISQVGSERIIKLTLKKDKIAKIYFELFGQGNIIICDENDTILYPLNVQKWADRHIIKGEKYDWFKKRENFFELTEKHFRSLEIKENISKTLAINFGFGGIYAEELCLRAKIDSKSNKVNKKNKKKLYNTFVKLLQEKLNPQIVLYEAVEVNDETLKKSEQKLIDITPIKLKKYFSFKNEPVSSFSEALEEHLLVEEKKSDENKKIKQLQKRIRLQEEMLQKYKEQMEENKKKAEYIYNNYEKIEELLMKGKEILKSHKKYEGIILDKKNKKIKVFV